MSAKNSIEPKKGVISFEERNVDLSKKETISMQECGVMVIFYADNGFPINYQYFSSDQPNLQSCQSYQTAIKTMLMICGYELSAL